MNEKTSTPVQLSLGVSLREETTFANFLGAVGSNAQPVAALQQFAANEGEQNVLVWGAPGSGLTHLLQAVCHRAYEHGLAVQYLPLQDMVGYDAQSICDGLEQMQVVCLDGIDHICGIKSWEQGVFHLYNNLRDAGHRLLIASHTSPPALPLTLPDLKSRVLGSVRYHVESLNDQQKQDALIARASARGMDMPVEVARFILNRASRDTNELFYLLDQLDDASLQKQRKLTVPFAKEVLNL
ncbi:DnaA regulatory inactivator Hda [Saccharophagus degradans]|uniref:DnaA regulatory inactivator Hda n=1 Tax=Saccharophagus degradans TaxID=86304 RepID=A0AAW7X7H9_9GAMM|nr:DnaA regulatory inactivator Hda [Saccharophagus degradans]MDO6423245.1 DnaA regulatory inactivator Hda [Saccharophagus degradans]MDO6607231.1 DnaA regulatory inactivator Hda [Saccharophagus degradans]